MENGTTNLKGGPAEIAEDAAAALLAAATAGCPPALAQRLMLDVVDAVGLTGNEDDDTMRAAAALQMMAAAAPRNPLEAMLAAQMAAVHSAAMRSMKRAAECTDYPRIEALYGRQASRLMGLFTRQMEALERRRASAKREEAAAETGDDRAVSKAPSPTPPPQAGEGLRSDDIALSRLGGGGLGGGGTRQGRASQKKRNGRRHRINGTGPPQ